MLVRGGVYGSESNDVRFSSNGVDWTIATDSADFSMYRNSALVFDNKIWLIGGQGGAGTIFYGY